MKIVLSFEGARSLYREEYVKYCCSHRYIPLSSVFLAPQKELLVEDEHFNSLTVLILTKEIELVLRLNISYIHVLIIHSTDVEETF